MSTPSHLSWTGAADGAMEGTPGSMPHATQLPLVDADLLQRYDRPGPRYTSYPTAVEFHEGFTGDEYAAHLGRLPAADPLSLYVHLPFCRRRCTFCGCHVVIAPRRDVAVKYLDSLERELELLSQHLPGRRQIGQYHWGGGTPTYYTPEEMARLQAAVRRHFDLLPEAEVAVEVDPRVTTREHVDALVELGFNRISMGVQDFTPAVQEAIGRNQTEAETSALYEYCRERGFDSINIDLIYGLPGQTEETFQANLEAVVRLRPDRVAVYSYAHVPWVRAHQKRLNTDLLPSRDTKFALFARAIRAFRERGYEQIGMDHFSLPDDELAAALRERCLRRNFMGYTVQRAPHMVGLGLSSIGDVAGAYAQNAKKLSAYWEHLEAGRLPVERGYALSDDDRVRRHVIAELMCNLYLDTAAAEGLFGIRFASYFARELAELAAGPEADGLVRLGDDALEVTPLGQLFVRNVCMPFDRHLREKPPERPTFSRTV